MPHYRVYFLGGGNRINEAIDLDCKNDDEAIEKATGVRYTHAIEVWQGTRLVKRIDPPE
jgi:hypothetical protein